MVRSPVGRWFAVSALPFVSLGVALALVFVDIVLAAAVAILGVFVLTPLLALVFAFRPPASESDDAKSEQSATGDVGPVTEDVGSATDDDIDALRARYVAGEIDETEFERSVERALGADSEKERTTDRPDAATETNDAA